MSWQEHPVAISRVMTGMAPIGASWHHRAMPRSADVAAMFNAHGPHVYRRALQLMGNPADAEEAAQEVFIRAIRNLDGFKGEDPGGWLYRITTNYCLNQLRDRKRRRELFEEHVKPMSSSRDERTPDAMIMLRWLLANADERQAICAAYTYIDDLPYDQVAELMGVSKRTVSNLLNRFRRWAQAQIAQLESTSGNPK